MLETALSIGYISFFLWVIGKSTFFKHENIGNRNFQWLFIIKLAAGLALYLVYTRYYPDRKYADIFRYYDDSKIIYDSFSQHPYDFFRMLTGYHQTDNELMLYYNQMNNWFNSEMIFNDARTMIRLNLLFRFLSAGTYYPVSIFFCFLAFCGLTALFKVAASEYKDRTIVFIAGIFCMPSILFWTSGVVKETFLVFAIGFMIYHINRLCDGQGNIIRHLLSLLFFIFCLLNIKSYVFFAILPGIITFAWIKFKRNNALIKLLSVHVIYFILLYSFSFEFTHHPVPELLRNKQLEFYAVANGEHAKSIIRLPELEPTLSSVLKNAPCAFSVTLFRPHLFEVHNIMMLMSAVENAFIIILILANFYLLLKKRKDKENASPLFFLSCGYVIITFCLIGLVTPVLGAVVRYKVAALPFLMLILFSQTSWKNSAPLFKWLTWKIKA